jgi:hypothetical protein
MGESRSPQETLAARQALSLRDSARAHQEYVVKVKERMLRDDLESVTINLVYRQAPAAAAAYEAVAAEIAAYIVDHRVQTLDGPTGFAQVGDADKPNTWNQVKDYPDRFVAAWYNTKTDSVLKFSSNDVLVANVLRAPVD